MTYLLSFDKSNTTGAISGVGNIYLSESPEFTLCSYGVRVAQSLIFCAMFVDHYLSFCPFSFGHYFFCRSSIYCL